MINLFFVVHDHFGARTYADELLRYLNTKEEIILHLLFFKSRHYKEFTVINGIEITEIHLPKPFTNIHSSEKYENRCIDLLQPFVGAKKNIVFHLNYNNQINLGIRAREIFGARLVYTLHFLPSYFSYAVHGNRQNNKSEIILDEFEKCTLKEVDHVICVTHFAKKVICLWYDTPVDKVTVIHNGIGDINKSEFLSSTNKREMKNELGIDYDEQIILFVGSIEKRKGISYLVSAFDKLTKKISNCRLIIAGNGDFTDIFRLGKDCWGKVTLTGKITPNEVHQLYQIADIGVIPSVFEQCSYVALEMMKNGLPTVVSDVPGLNELYRDGENALLVPLYVSNNKQRELELLVDELSGLIEKLLIDDKLRHKIKLNAQEDWINLYTAKNMGQTTLSVYNKLI